MTQDDVKFVVEAFGEKWHIKDVSDIVAGDDTGGIRYMCCCGEKFIIHQEFELHLTNNPNPNPLSSDPAVSWAAFGWLWYRYSSRIIDSIIRNTPDECNRLYELKKIIYPVRAWEKALDILGE